MLSGLARGLTPSGPTRVRPTKAAMIVRKPKVCKPANAPTVPTAAPQRSKPAAAPSRSKPNVRLGGLDEALRPGTQIFARKPFLPSIFQYQHCDPNVMYFF